MTGRGIDQILPHPGSDELHEGVTRSSLEYVRLAEATNGAISRPSPFDYIWGDALGPLGECDMRIVNLETSITTSREYGPKFVHYKMHPANVACLTRAKIDCCALANNHVMDFGRVGLLETLASLEQAGLGFSGAGANEAQARNPLMRTIPGKRRLLVFSYGSTTSGIPEEWAAGPGSPGVNLLRDLSVKEAKRIAAGIQAIRRPEDIVVVSLHWGGNFGYDIPPEQTRFAHLLVDAAAIDVIHGHSSHHAKGIELYHGCLILYGTGDFVNDYEGIPGYEAFRDDLVLLYRVELRASASRTSNLTMVPFQIKRFRLNRASRADAEWLCETLNRESRRFGTQFALAQNGEIGLVR